MPVPPPPGQPGGYPLNGPFPTGQTGGKGKPVAPKANAAWTRLSGAVATQLPTALRQAQMYRRNALRALR